MLSNHAVAAAVADFLTRSKCVLAFSSTSPAVAQLPRMQEGWDGPALLIFSDGRKVGARLDRNGLRPARFWRTKDDVIYVASEVRTVCLRLQSLHCHASHASRCFASQRSHCNRAHMTLLPLAMNTCTALRSQRARISMRLT